MVRTSLRTLALAGILVGATACFNDELNGPSDDAFAIMGTAFNSAPVGADLSGSSFAFAGDGMPWEGPGRGRGPMMRGRGPIMGGREMMGGPGMGGLMGGGLEANFAGEKAQGRGAGRGPFGLPRIDDSCAVGGGTVTCTTTRAGLEVKTVYTIKDAAGAVQTRIDSATTNSIASVTTVKGTTTRGRDGEVTATVDNSSERTVTGLAPSSAERTVNGKSTNSETSSGKNREGVSFTSKRIASDETIGLVIPNGNGAQAYPRSGTVKRSMTVTVTLEGSAPITKTRSETITYDGTATAKVVIVDNGETKNCTMTLPRGRPACQ